MTPAPKWLKHTSLAVTTIVGAIFYAEGLMNSDDTLIYSGVVLIIIGLLSWVATIKVDPDA